MKETTARHAAEDVPHVRLRRSVTTVALSSLSSLSLSLSDNGLSVVSFAGGQDTGDHVHGLKQGILQPSIGCPVRKPNHGVHSRMTSIPKASQSDLHPFPSVSLICVRTASQDDNSNGKNDCLIVETLLDTDPVSYSLVLPPSASSIFVSALNGCVIRHSKGLHPTVGRE